MRITNNMITSSMMITLNRNARNVNGYYTQISTTKRFQQASEDPIAASRALRFRTSIAETLQFQKNVAAGQSWMDVTDQAFSNANEILKGRLTELLTQGSNDTLELEDRQKIATDIQSLVAQIAEEEMNVTNAGRYVFSGFRTDEPPVLTATNNDMSFEINQNFNFNNIVAKTSFQKDGIDGASTINDVNVINLGYSKIDDGTLVVNGIPVTTLSTVEGDPDYNANAYDVEANNPGGIVLIKETGELVLSESAVEKFKAAGEAGIDVTYVKTGFDKGELNPKVYFDVKDLNDLDAGGNPREYLRPLDDMEYGVSVGTKMKVNSNASEVYTDNMHAILNNFVNTINNMTISSDDYLREKYVAMGLTGDDLENAIQEQKTIEENNAKTVGHNLFNGMLGQLKGFMSEMSTQHTNLGTRMKRMDLIDNRLSNDVTNYTKLMSDNEDTDFMEAIMKLNSADTAYQASMQIGAKIMQMSLINYL